VTHTAYIITYSLPTELCSQVLDAELHRTSNGWQTSNLTPIGTLSSSHHRMRWRRPFCPEQQNITCMGGLIAKCSDIRVRRN